MNYLDAVSYITKKLEGTTTKMRKIPDLFKVTVTGYKLQLHFEKCNRLQLHEVTFRKNVTGYSYMKLLFKKM